MIRTTIITGIDEQRFPIWHKSAGLAKSLPIAQWLFEYTGWQYPADLCYEVGVVEWPESSQYFPENATELWVLENRLYMN